MRAHDGSVRSLTTKEAELLAYLVQHSDRDVERGELLEQVWGYRATTRTRTVDTTIKTLRKKVERDPKRPEHLITVHGLGYRFVGIERPPSRIPSEVGPFVGRAEAVARLGAHMRGEGPPVCTIVGPGGAGKTRLAQHVARRLDAETWWVDLPRTDDPQAVLQAVARAMDVRIEALPDRVRTAGTIVLDEAEGSVDAVREALGSLPEHRWVVTSRVPLGLENEAVLRLGGLPPTEAVALVTELASRRGVTVPDFEAIPLVERLDGLPLALELAAARLTLLTPAQLLEHLDLDLLGGGDRTLRAVVAWSWNLLSRTGRTTLMRLGSFAAEFDVEAAGAVLEKSGAELLDALDEVLAASLVRSVPTELPHRRFRLWEAVRAFAFEQLSADPDRVTELHAKSHALRTEQWSKQAVGPNSSVARELLWRALPDTLSLPGRVRRIAPEWACRTALGGLLPLMVAGSTERADALVQAAITDGAGHPEWHARALIQRVHLDQKLGRSDAAADGLRQLDDAFESLPRVLQGEILRARAGLGIRTGDLASAERDYLDARVALTEAGDPRTAALCLADAGTVLGWQGRLVEAVDALDTAATELADCAGPVDRCMVLANLASQERTLGRRGSSAAHARAALRASLAAKYRSVEAQAIAILGLLALDEGDLDEAGELLGRGEQLFAEIGNPTMRALVLGVRAELAVLVGNVDAAELALERLGRDELAPAAKAQVNGSRIRTLLALGRNEEARVLAEGNALWTAWLDQTPLPEHELAAYLQGADVPDVAPAEVRLAAYIGAGRSSR